MRIVVRQGMIVGVLCALVLAVTAATAQARSSAQYRIEGRGWGHGIGLSQYGADGYAKRGLTGEQIIRHYYTGTVVAPRPADGPTQLRVLLQSFLAPARVQLLGAGTVTQGAATLPLLAGDVVEMAKVGSTLRVTRVRAGVRTVLAPASGAPATITPAVDGDVATLFTSDHARSGSRFHGTLTGVRFGSGVSVVNNVGVEQYLRGVVPDEMPPSWHPEALKAQAIAARSYALTGLANDHDFFDMYSDTRSQVYGGITSEEASTDTAIAATAGMVARVGGPDGEMARTFFFSTSAGRTAANEDVFSPTPFSYLRSVPSPYESSQYFLWKGDDVKRYTPASLAAKLGRFSGSFRGISQTQRPSGYVDDVIVAGSAGSGTISGPQVQARLGLRSSYFRIGLLSIGAPDTAPAAGYTRIAGRAPVAGRTSLLLRANGVTKLVPLKVTKAGTWVVRARVTAPTVATLTRAGLAGPAITIAGP